uniref:Uncharacterized protein n=1 Tax=Anguilla anguilla TaxID=7936 RepID=A0A0E9TXK0_ANGAN
MYVQIGAVSTSLLKNVLIYFYFISSGLKHTLPS